MNTSKDTLSGIKKGIYFNFKINRADAVVDTEKAVLIKIKFKSEDFEKTGEIFENLIWVQKFACYKDDFALSMKVGLNTEIKYTVNDEPGILGKDLISAIEKNAINVYISKK